MSLQLEKETIISISFQILSVCLTSPNYDQFIQKTRIFASQYFSGQLQTFERIHCFQKIICSTLHSKNKKISLAQYLSYLKLALLKNRKLYQNLQLQQSNCKIKHILSCIRRILNSKELLNRQFWQLTSYIKVRISIQLNDLQYAYDLCSKLATFYYLQQRYRYQSIEILFLMKRYKRCQSIIDSRLKAFAAQHRYPFQIISEYNSYSCMNEIIKQKNINFYNVLTRHLSLSLEDSPTNRNVLKYAISFQIINKLDKAYHNIITYNKLTNNTDKQFFLPAFAYYTLLRNQEQQALDSLTKINNILAQHPYKQCSFYQYSHFINSINLIVGIYDIKIPHCRNPIQQKVNNWSLTVGIMLYRKGQYQKSLQLLQQSKNGCYRTIVQIDYRIILCKIKLKRIQQVKYIVDEMRMSRNCDPKILVLFLQIYSKLQLKEDLKYMFSKIEINSHKNLNNEQEIQFGIIQLINSSLYKHRKLFQLKVLNRIISIVKSQYVNLIIPQQFHHYLHQLYFLISYCFQRQKLIQGRLLAMHFIVIIQRIQRISPISASSYMKMLQKRSEFDIQMIDWNLI